MSLNVPLDVIEQATDEMFVRAFERARTWRSSDVEVKSPDLTDERLADLAQAADKAQNKSFARVVGAIQAARSGNFTKAVPRLNAAPQMLKEFFAHHLIDGWVYREETDGHLHAFLVTSITYERGRQPADPDYVSINWASTGHLGGRDRGSMKSGHGVVSGSITLYGADVTKKRIPDILLAARLLVETPDLKADYEAATAHHREVLLGGFTEQFTLSGAPFSTTDADGGRVSYRDPQARTNRKVINDTAPGDVTIAETAPSKVFADDGDDAVLPLPVHHVVRVFDLATHEYLTVNTRDLTRYVFDPSLGNKLVLPDSHRDLLDILTTDIATFTGDIIEGKSAGNVILAKGVPGVGKTLTAEVYSELIQRPLYSIHSGALGISADQVRKNLEEIFKRAKRWNAVLLLDEADVFVLERGTDITQNAIVAEFLRTMEYFDGLMFMTTNRAANIDEAIISRCAAIIAYDIPEYADALRIWHVLAANFGVNLAEGLAEDLATGFYDIAPRDVKMLLRLALRVAAHEQVALTVDVFRKVSMFRGLTFHQSRVEARHEGVAVRS